MDVGPRRPGPDARGRACSPRSMRADLGVMISASAQSLYEDNGIKFFGPDGFKLSDADRGRRSKRCSTPTWHPAPSAPRQARPRHPASTMPAGRYMEAVPSTTFPQGFERLDGLRRWWSTARNGAAYRTAPDRPLGTRRRGRSPIAVSPDGFNINQGCGSDPPRCRRSPPSLRERRADLGISARRRRRPACCIIDETRPPSPTATSSWR